MPAIVKELHTVDGTSQCAKAWNLQNSSYLQYLLLDRQETCMSYVAL